MLTHGIAQLIAIIFFSIGLSCFFPVAFYCFSNWEQTISVVTIW